MPDSPYYKPHQLEELQQGYSTVNSAYERLIDEYLSLRLTNETAHEYVRHGFVRRLGTLKRCIGNVYRYTYLRGLISPQGMSVLTSASTCRASCSMSSVASTILHGFGSRNGGPKIIGGVHYAVSTSV
jgi:hypothetical protein